MFTTLQNASIEIDLLVQGNSVGWSVDDDIATHEACNEGSITLEGKTLTAGETWSFSYRINEISGSYLQPFMGTTAGVQRTSAGTYTETLLVAGTNPKFRFYAPATTACEIAIFNIQQVSQSTALKQDNTTAFSEKTNKWNPHYTYQPDCAYSLFTNLFSYKFGNLWSHDNAITPRNNFYGQQYLSILKPVFNQSKGEVKTFQSISLQSNQLLVTTESGIETSLGQISELIEQDFLVDVLEGTTNIEVYDKEGIFQASFLRDKNIDLLDGDQLKGNFIAVELITVNAGKLKLLTATCHSVVSKTGTRN